MSYTPVPPPFADELTPGWARFVNTVPGVTNDSEKELINFNLPQGETLITIPFAATKASSDLVLVGPVFVNVVDEAVISDITFSVVNFSTSAMTIVLSSAVDTANYYLKTIVFVVGAFPSTNTSQSGLSGSGGGIATSINFGSILNLPTTLGGYGITDAEMSLGDPSVDGYVLSSTTGGTRSWISPSSFSLPTQVDQAGKFLQSNGTDTAWIDALDLHSAQTMTNKVIDGAANTLQNIPRTALEGYATSTLSLTDPNADSVPYWNDLAGEFQWTPVAGIAAPASIAAFMGTSTVRGINKEIHIAVRTDGKVGTGTAEDPFDGSGTNFDTKLASLSGTTNITIHLGPGTFTTNVATSGLGSAFYVKSGWRIVGSGMYVTTVQMTGSMTGQHFDHQAFKAPSTTPADNVTISDLTIDANYSVLSASADTVNSEKYYVAYGVGINGSHNALDRVRLINQYGTFANGGECFGLALGAATAGSVGATIRNCVVELPHGTYAGAPFAVGGIDTTHLMSDWSVHDNWVFGANDGQSTATFNTGGVNIAFTERGEIYNNHFVDARGIVYSDTGNIKTLRIHNNRAVRAWQGVGFVSDEVAQPTWTKTDISCSGNVISIQDRVGGEHSAFRFAGGSGISITGSNVVTKLSGGVGGGAAWTVLADNSVDTITVNDLIGPNENAEVVGTNISLNRNRTPVGGTITGLEDSSAVGNFTSVNIAAGGNLNQSGVSILRLSDNTNTVINPVTTSGGLFLNWDRGTNASSSGVSFGNGATTTVAKIYPSGGAVFGGVGTDPGAGNIVATGLTASNYVKTDSGQKLVSTATIPGTDLSLTDVTTNNASTSNHGFLPKLDNTATHFLNGQGGWTTPNGADQLGLTPTAVKTANYSAAAGDLVPCDTTSAGFTVTLPTAPADKSVVAIKHVIQGGTNTVSLATGGSDVFNKASGGTTGTLTLVNQGILLQYKASGAIWYAIADDIPLSGMDARFATAAQGTLAASAVQPSTAPTLTGTNFTGTASLNINGTVGATTPAAGTFTTLLANTSAAIGLGATTPPSAFVVGDTSTSSPRGIMSWQSSTGTDGARLHLRKSRGTFASPTTVVSGDTLGRVVATGYDGTSFLEMGSINILSTGTIATNRVPTQMVFQTATDAAPSVLTTALTLGADQSATFAGTVAGAFNGTIGATTPAAGTFTTLTDNGNLTFGTSASVLNGTTGSIGITATGTNQNIALTPSGSGVVTAGRFASGTPASGIGAGEISAATSSTRGIYYFGSGGTQYIDVSSAVLNFNGITSIVGGAGNMTFTSGTGNSRTMILKTTTSGGTATTALTLGADQRASFNAPANVKSYTVSTLPTGNAGDMAQVSDGDSSLAWGATVANSGSGATKYLVWFNGSNWTVAGK